MTTKTVPAEPKRRPGRAKGQTAEPVVISPDLSFAREEFLPPTGAGIKLEPAILDALRESETSPLSAAVKDLGGTFARAESVIRRHASHLGKGVAIRKSATHGDSRIVFQMKDKRVRS